MFSYFHERDGRWQFNDNQITAAELYEYVEQNVVQQSGGSGPKLQGDAMRTGSFQ